MPCYITDKYGESVFLKTAIICVMQQTGVADVIIAALFTGCVWELSALATGGSHGKTEGLFLNASLCDCYPANLRVGW